METQQQPVGTFGNKFQTAFQQTIYTLVHLPRLCDAVLALSDPRDGDPLKEAIVLLKDVVGQLATAQSKPKSQRLFGAMVKTGLILDEGFEVDEKLDVFLHQLGKSEIGGVGDLLDSFRAKLKHSFEGHAVDTHRITQAAREETLEWLPYRVPATHGDLAEYLRQEYTTSVYADPDRAVRLANATVEQESIGVTKVLKWSHLPPVLYFQLKRVEPDFDNMREVSTHHGVRYVEIDRKPIEGEFTFPVDLDMRPFCTGDVDPQDAIYRLAIIHSYIRDVEDDWTLSFQTTLCSAEGDWTLIDSDNQVKVIERHVAIQDSLARDAKDRKAYGLCYVRV
ncbi:Peptidase domain protein [Mollivirus kamchatka]|nr:Peptidase domain protein [Mollivirus kamchatka]